MLAIRRRLRAADRRDRPLDRLRQRHRRRRRRRAADRRQLDRSCPAGSRSSSRSPPAPRSALFQGSFVAFVGVPSFVVTLAGLLALAGRDPEVDRRHRRDRDPGRHDLQRRQLLLLRPGRAGSWRSSIAGLYVVGTLGGVLQRRRHGIAVATTRRSSRSSSSAVVLVTFARRLDLQQGPRRPVRRLLLIVGFLVFWTYVAKRTTFGRHVYAVGGNAEAARRAGINVARIRIIVFMISGAMAGLGGIVLRVAAQLASTSTPAAARS